MDIIKKNQEQVIKFKKESTVELNEDGRPILTKKDIAYEKVFEVTYWNGLETKTITVGNLNRKINGKTLENIITQSMLNPSGQIMIIDKDEDGNEMRKFIKAKTIQSCEQVWKRINVPKNI